MAEANGVSYLWAVPQHKTIERVQKNVTGQFFIIIIFVYFQKGSFTVYSKL